MPTADYTWAFLKMLFALGVVTMIAIIVLKYIIPRWGLPKKFKNGQYFEVLSRFYVGPGKFICLVKAGTQKFILGVTERGMNLIKEVNDDESDEGNN